MLNKESKTLREFTFTATLKNKSPITVRFGYDTSARHSGYFVTASIDNKPMRSDASTLKRVRSLKIDIINRIIDSIGLDVTGVPYDLETKAAALLHSRNVEDIQQYFHITSERDINLINKALYALNNAKSNKAIGNIISRFVNSQRLRLLERNRSLIQSIREMYQSGITLGDQHIIISFDGLLRMKYNPSYYKRDVDYIRKARVRLFKNVLKRSYQPFSI